jgi:hypothetical protein
VWCLVEVPETILPLSLPTALVYNYNGMIVMNELERTLKEAVMTYFKTLFRHVPLVNEETHRKPH